METESFKQDLRRIPDPETKKSEVEKRQAFLSTLGLSQDQINRVKVECPTLYDQNHVQRVIDDLRNLGFTDPVKMISSSPVVLGYHIENIKQKIDDLKNLGFADPVKMITSSMRILGLNIENIRQKIDDLKNLGFVDPVKMITSSPVILNYNIENIRQKIDDLKNLGFVDPVKMITSLPAIFGYGIENVKQKIDDLKNLGFGNPTKMITSMPAILGLNIENVKQKIDDLKNLGFLNPIKMITSSPQILGYSIENIKNKTNAVERIFRLYGIGVDTYQFVEKNVSLLGTKIDKIWIIARVLQILNFDPSNITETFLSKLLFANIANTAFATSVLEKSKGVVTQADVKRAIMEAKKLTKEEKELIISEGNTKLSQRYNRGYGNNIS